MRWVSSHLGFIAIFCVAFLVHNANAQKKFCSGTQVLSSLSGNITDHTGTLNYNNDMSCIWVIKPSSNTTVTSITLSFQKMDLEYSYDYLLIYNCECTEISHQYTWFTGSTIPQDVTVPGNIVTVVFYSDAYVTGEGFSLTYYANNCPGSCSGRGTCRNTRCECYPGYTGSDCSLTYCANNCSYPLGECNLATNSCVCDFGYYGGDCANPYCFGSSNISDSSGSFTDHRGYGDYLNNMKCQWLIQPNPPRQSITLSFTYFDTEAGYDFVSIYDGTSESSSALIARFSGSNIPPRAIASSGSMLVVWTSDVGVARTGFDASFTSTDCPGACSEHGDCIDGDCHCDVGFSGLDCSFTACTDDCFDRGVCNDFGNGSQACDCTDTDFTGGNCGTCIAQNETCPIEYCYSYYHMHDIAGGIISDKISGEGNYKPGQECIWTIEPTYNNTGLNISGIALNFTKLELELNQARVYVYRGTTAKDANLIGVYTGEELPSIINLDETAMAVKFSSSGDNIVRQGFSASWSITYCPTNCNGNGVCGYGNVCECYPGWNGTACNQTVCVGTCNSPNGQCLDSRCVCEPGWYSASCSSTYCSGQTILDGDFGVVKDHGDGDTYRPNSDCSFKIQHQNTSETYSIVWTKFDLDGTQGDTIDYVSLYDGPQKQGSQVVLNGKTGSFLPHPFKSTVNSLYMEFHSGEAVNFPGFAAVYTANSKCPSACSKSGYCYNGTCICDLGTTGSDCSQKAPTVVLDDAHEITGSVTSFQWTYYAYKVPKNSDYLSIQSYQTSSQGSAEFFFRAYDYPGLYHYDFVIGLGYTNVFTVKNPPEGTILYVGVYENSLDYSNFTITIAAQQNEESPDYRGAAIALAVIVFTLFGVAGVCVFFLWKKLRAMKKEQRATQADNTDSHEMGNVSLQAPSQQGSSGYARFEDE